jgi:hypothetical protein
LADKPVFTSKHNRSGTYMYKSHQEMETNLSMFFKAAI